MSYLIYLFVFTSACFSTAVHALDTSEQSPRLLVHLLDYVALDYSGAVQKGKIIADAEYKEQLEFADALIKMNGELPETRTAAGISEDLVALKKAIVAKVDSPLIEKKARDLKWKIIGVSGITLAPTVWPDLKRGEAEYRQTCAACHGATGHGDGPRAAALDPKPANFFEAKMAHISPFQAFNAIRLGVPGTAMASWPDYTESEVWNLAFYVVSLRHRNESKPVVALATTSNTPTPPLQQVSTLSDEELKAQLPAGSDSDAVLSAIRLRTGMSDDATAFVDIARSNLREAQENYHKGMVDSAQRMALMAYLNGIEPVEPRLRATDPGLLVEIESKMTAIRSAIDTRRPAAEIDTKITNALEIAGRVEGALKSESSPAMTYTVSFGIVLREAFEAILLLITLLGVIRSIGSRKAAAFVHLGWISAVGMGVVSWMLSGWVLQMSGARREVLEGVTSIVAVVVVMYMGFWLHRKTEMGRWRAFLNDMVKTALSGKSLFLLAGISFMAVFREAFETVLFLRAVMLESGGGHQAAMISGVLTALFLVILLAIALLRFSARIPIRQLFSISSVIMILLSFILMGKALHSFQEVGMLPVTAFPFDFRADLIGIYPTYETLVPQLVILLLSVAFWFGGRRPSRVPELHHS
jgi:high-affinity iron transporter